MQAAPLNELHDDDSSSQHNVIMTLYLIIL